MLHVWSSYAMLALTIAAAGIMLAAALQDLIARAIPNWMALVLATIGLILRIVGNTLPLGLLAGGTIFAIAMLTVAITEAVGNVAIP